MTKNPARKNQVGQPSNNGGHFAAVAKTEAPTDLIVKSPSRGGTALAELHATAAAVKAAHEAQVAAAPAAMRELIRDIYPEAHTAQFRQRTDFGHSYIEPVGFLDADGERIYDENRIENGQWITGREGSSDLARELRTIGRMFSKEREAEGMRDFATSHNGGHGITYTLSLTDA